MSYDNPPGKTHTWQWPVNTTVISGYGFSGTHHALDIGARKGSKLFAPTDGTVYFAGWNDQGYGNLIIIKAWNGDMIYMAHLSEINVKKGMNVQTGETIGKTGSTGNSSGPHLHFEIRTPGGGGWINPYSIFGNKPKSGVEVIPAPTGNQTPPPPTGNQPPPPGTTSTVSNPSAAGDILGLSGLADRFAAWFHSINWANWGVAALGVTIALIGIYGLVAGESAHIIGGGKSSIGLE